MSLKNIMRGVATDTALRCVVVRMCTCSGVPARMLASIDARARARSLSHLLAEFGEIIGTAGDLGGAEPGRGHVGKVSVVVYLLQSHYGK
jgi:hypothetical protein